MSADVLLHLLNKTCKSYKMLGHLFYFIVLFFSQRTQ